MSRWTLICAAILGGAVATAGCAKKSATYPGAVYAETAVAAYKSAEFDGAMGGESSGDGETSESMSWFFNTEDPMDQVVAFYETNLTGATKEVGEGEVTFRFVPAGAEPGEECAVIVSEGRIQIHESTRAGKHKDADCYDKAMEETGLGWAK